MVQSLINNLKQLHLSANLQDDDKMAPVTSFIHNLDKFHLSYMADIGLRDCMEDKMDIRVLQDGLLITLCDGHGGVKCAEFVIEKYPEEVSRLFKEKKRPMTALKQALRTVVKLWDTESVGKFPKNLKQRIKIFSSIDENEHRTSGNASGTTLVAVYIDPKMRKCYVLNLGDSRASWHTANTVTSTTDHKPSFEDALLLNQFPIWIQLDEDVSRLNGDLAVGRTIGDNTPLLTGCILREPSVKTIDYSKCKLRLILASDGLWDECKDQDLFHDSDSCYDFIDKTTDDNIAIAYVVHGI
jgi:serine/threonine protein phosphatase PrpC